MHIFRVKIHMRPFFQFLYNVDPAQVTNHIEYIFYEKGSCHQVTFHFSISASVQDK